MSTSTPTDLQLKDRKKSAHWSDADTDILINILVRHKDAGRTSDNGFKPEVWREAAGLFEGTTFVGGPKTADACKSRWQRLQRDFRAAKDMEALPGFVWDRTVHRLSAPPDAWEAAEKHMDPYKYQKIHLPCYDLLTLLCPHETPRNRLRTSTSNGGRPRSSLANSTVSESSSMLSLGVSGSSGSTTTMPQTPTPGGGRPHMGGGPHMGGQMGVGIQHPGGASAGQAHASSARPGQGQGQGQGQGNGSGLGQDNPDMRLALSQSMSGLTSGQMNHGHTSQHDASHAQSHMMSALGEGGLMTWGGEGDDDGDGDLDASFGMSGNSHFTLPSGKRMSFDPSLLAGPTQPQPQQPQQPQQPSQPLLRQSPPKRPRISSRPAPIPQQTHVPSHPHSHPQGHPPPTPTSSGNPGQHQGHPPHQQQQQQQQHSHAHAPGNGQATHGSQHQQQHQHQHQHTGSQHSHTSMTGYHIPLGRSSSDFQDSLLDTATLLNSPSTSSFHVPHNQHSSSSHPSHPPHPSHIPLPHAHVQPHTVAPSSAPPLTPQSQTPSSTSLPTSSSLRSFPPLPSHPNPNPNPAPTPPHSQSQSPNAVSPYAPEISAAGLSDAQRRTEAILQLQERETDMRDEDIVEVMAEFEGNVAAADTYLAIKREGLRKLWLQKVVKRRKRS